jgi:hypothetical protein
VVTPQAFSQATSWRSPAVWAGNSRAASEPSGVAATQAQWLASPTSMPAAWGFCTGRAANSAACLAWRAASSRARRAAGVLRTSMGGLGMV